MPSYFPGDPELLRRQKGFSPPSRQRPEFGTNTGNQGTFDSADPAQKSQAVRRLQELQQQYGGRLTPNFTGPTGLAKNDGKGWSKMLNAQTEAQNIQRGLDGKGPLQVEFDSRPVLSLPQESQSTVWSPDQTGFRAVRPSPATGFRSTDYRYGSVPGNEEVNAEAKQQRFEGSHMYGSGGLYNQSQLSAIIEGLRNAFRGRR